MHVKIANSHIKRDVLLVQKGRRYDALLEALERFIYWYDGPNTDGVIVGIVADKARATIRAAKGETA